MRSQVHNIFSVRYRTSKVVSKAYSCISFKIEYYADDNAIIKYRPV